MNENSGYKDLDDDIVELLQKFDNMVNSSNYSYVDYDDCIVILDSYIYLGEINKAKIALDYFVSLHPGKKLLSEYFVKIAFMEGDYSKVSSLVDDPDAVSDPMLLAILAESLVCCNKLEKSKYAFELYLIKETNYDDLLKAFFRIATVYNEYNAPSYAIYFLNIGKTFFPDDDELMFEFAESYYLKGNLKKAKSYLEALLKKDENNYNALKLCINICFELQLFDEAVVIADRCMKINPFDTDVAVNKGRALYNLSKVKESVSFLEEYNHRNPNIEVVQSDLAGFYVTIGKERKALGMYQSLVEKHPQNMKYVSALGVLLFNFKEHKKAIPFLKKSFDDSPSGVVAMCLAISFYSEKDINNSYKYLKIAAGYDRRNISEFYSIFPSARHLFSNKKL